MKILLFPTPKVQLFSLENSLLGEMNQKSFYQINPLPLKDRPREYMIHTVIHNFETKKKTNENKLLQATPHFKIITLRSRIEGSL